MNGVRDPAIIFSGVLIGPKGPYRVLMRGTTPFAEFSQGPLQKRSLVVSADSVCKKLQSFITNEQTF